MTAIIATLSEALEQITLRKVYGPILEFSNISTTDLASTTKYDVAAPAPPPAAPATELRLISILPAEDDTGSVLGGALNGRSDVTSLHDTTRKLRHQCAE